MAYFASFNCCIASELRKLAAAAATCLVFLCFADEIPFRTPLSGVLTAQNSSAPLMGGAAAVRSASNSHQANGNGHHPGHKAAWRTTSDGTEITTVSLESSPSDTSPQRADASYPMGGGDLRVHLPPVPSVSEQLPSSGGRTHIYHLVDDGKGGRTPLTEETVVVDVPTPLPVPTSGYQVPQEEMEVSLKFVLSVSVGKKKVCAFMLLLACLVVLRTTAPP